MDELEGRRAALEAEIAAASGAPAPRLHPNLPEAYRARVARLREALASAGPNGVKALEAARTLVARVEGAAVASPAITTPHRV
jgi:hypothetical protein